MSEIVAWLAGLMGVPSEAVPITQAIVAAGIILGAIYILAFLLMAIVAAALEK